MTDDKPLVSIGMPVYNAEKYIRQALDSLVAQDYENFELIISDNASTDRTQEICLEYAARDKRIRYYRNETNLGAVKNFNRVFELSRGKYFMWASHDDLWDATYVRKCVDVLEHDPSLVLCCTSLRFIEESGSFLDIPYDNYDNPDMSSLNVRERMHILASRHGWYAIYGLVRSDVLRKTSLFRTSYGADVILLMELCLIGPFFKVPEVLFYYRQYHTKTEKDRASSIDPAGHCKPSYSNLSRELVRTVLISNLHPFTKILVALELVSIYFRSSAWRTRLGVPSLHSLRARLRGRTRLKRVIEAPRRVLGLLRDVYVEWSPRKAKQGLKCALIEYNYYHGEILPMLVYVLNALGISVDVYVSRRVMHNDPFIYCTGLNCTLRETDGLFFKQWVERRQFRDYDFLVLNSLEPKEILQQVSGIPIPIIAIIHNGSLIKNDPDYARFFTAPIRAPLVLAEHISRFLSDTLIARWVWPAQTLDQVKAQRQGKICFCVQGNMEFDRRNYDSLLDDVEQLTSSNVRNFHVMIIGRNDTKEGLIFKKQVRNRKLDSFFTFSKGEVPYKDYYDSIASAHFILPLIDTTRSEYRPYFFEKGSTSLCIALSLGIVPIIHKQLACIYGIEDQSITYEDNGLAHALEQALSTNEQALERMRGALVSRKEYLLKKSVLNMKETLKDVGINASFTSP
ncbi:MAG: hypothetical protein A2253_08325 [Deltaproteobacteria bacterium RIFOXYA2_FULL_55_11]|nr:MAG: hypothetical protein A2253_08325 [Deltaproteobacteria bacterium RIFOXYA2_FULL_55_11]